LAEVLIIGSDSRLRRRVREILKGDGFRLSEAEDAETARSQLASQRHDAAIFAADWPSNEVRQRVRALRRAAGDIPLLALCSTDHVDHAALALRGGADDYLLSPPDAFELRARLDRVIEKQDLDSRIAFYQDQLSRRSALKSVEARSPAMRSALARVLRVAPMRSTVLIHGESGVGKELVARSIHFNSPRRDHPFIALNCAAIPSNLIETELFGHEKGSFTGAHARVRGKFEIADRGSLFLDEIGEMDPSTQVKLLRVLEQREFMRVGGSQSVRIDVRLIAATNADLEKLVADGAFRRDLYYRLKVVTIRVPPLRERREDIRPLIKTFLADLARENAVPRKEITPEAMTALEGHAWPGNVRELKNLLESVLVSVPGDSIGIDDLPLPFRDTPAASLPRPELKPGMTLAEAERALIYATLEHTGGNRTHSAALLGIGVRTLQRKIGAYGIDIRPTRRRSRRPKTRRS
jgi:DNA-binding NtrC family response regulator